MSDKVTEGRVVWIELEVTDNATGEAHESAGGALTYLHGGGSLPPALEEALEGAEEGQQFDLVATPEGAYGLREEGWPKLVPRKELKGLGELRKGRPFRARGTGDASAVFWVVEVRGSRVAIDANHPLAGRSIRFSGEVRGIREAKAEELEHGHAHGWSGLGHRH